MVRVERSALDAWFVEDEETFVHPRNAYTGRPTRHVLDRTPRTRPSTHFFEV